ncbi:serine hydrolase [Telluribacter sp.]|jgi:CubicO group peptidase (beta-lactamase class C family)|uniref:serine hydrolase n=1 Tax=Telluribacter sp. TaxID=1978767 RepID=UPI002E0EB757|nr:serine hydrolase [Telluribacter sp.]
MQPTRLPSLLLLLFAVLTTAPTLLAQPNNTQPNPVYSPEVEERIRRVEQSLGEAIKIDDAPVVLQERMQKYKVPGVSIAVIKDHKLDWARGYGFADKEQTTPVTPQTLFQAASISKSLNAVGVLKLVQDKKVDLDTDINTYLSSWKFPYDSSKGKKPITLRHLLSHTAGTSVHGFRGYAAGEKVPTVIQVLNGESPANSQPVRSLFDAGTKTQYSGGGTTISQLVVMDKTGLPYDRYAQQQVLDPLGMTSSFYTIPPPANKVPLLSTGYRGDGNPVVGKYHQYPEQGAAALWTSPTDLSQYIIEMQLASAGTSAKVLNRELTTTMLTPIMNEAALGVFIRKAGNDRYFGHSGANEGFRCAYLGSLEGGNGVVVMVNSDNGAIIDEIINSVATVYNWKDFYNPVVRRVVTVPDEVLDTYVGEYELNPQFRVKIVREGHGLKVQATNQPVFDLFAEAPNKFFLKAFDAQIEFVKDDSNKISSILMHQNGQARPAQRVK